MFGSIETNRLLMRCVAADDAIDTSKLMTPDISRWLASWPYPFSEEMAAEKIKQMRELACRGDAVPLAIVVKASQKLAGWITFTRDEPDRRRASCGYWLGSSFHGNGYMKEAAPVALRFAFDRINCNLIEAGAQLENTESFSVMRTCGMTVAGDRLLHAAARNRDEMCRFYEIERSAAARTAVASIP